MADKVGYIYELGLLTCFWYHGGIGFQQLHDCIEMYNVQMQDMIQILSFEIL